MTFNGSILTGRLTVTGPGGSVASVDNGARDPRSNKRLLVELRRGLKAGVYKASWGIVAVDGHHERGTVSFRLEGSAVDSCALRSPEGSPPAGVWMSDARSSPEHHKPMPYEDEA